MRKSTRPRAWARRMAGPRGVPPCATTITALQAPGSRMARASIRAARVEGVVGMAAPVSRYKAPGGAGLVRRRSGGP
uniref:Uncharacterized protein n=1 Tax=uncultured marine virus TaxID=186617 RepID=A0A0F7L852_9VIRU|nr:hypothetical protein [uncultured marine virus]